MDKSLSDEQPMLILPQLAKDIGLNESVVLQQIHYWIKNNEQKKRNFHDGYYWTYNTFEGWGEQFPFWSIATIKRIFKKLEDEKLLIVGNYNKKPYDRTKWYRIDYIQLGNVATSHSIKMTQSIVSKCDNGKYQNDTMHSVKMTPTIPENNTETNKRYKDNRKQVYDEDNTYFKMAIYFHEKVSTVANDEGISHLIKKSNMQTWADDMRKLIELDQVDKHLAKQVMDWVTQDSFWRTNVLSAKKLREKFMELAIKMNADKKPVQPKLKQQYDPRDKEIELQRWIQDGNDPNDFDWSN